MKITNQHLREEYAQPGHCEICQRYCLKREGHHLRTRTPELTIRINLISLGSTPLFCCPCHFNIGQGKIRAIDVLKIVARREGTTPVIITEVMDLFRRLVRPTPSQLKAGLMELSLEARSVAMKALNERRYTAT